MVSDRTLGRSKAERVGKRGAGLSVSEGGGESVSGPQAFQGKKGPTFFYMIPPGTLEHGTHVRFSTQKDTW